MRVLRDIGKETRFERSNRILAPELRGYVRRKVRHAHTYAPGGRGRERARSVVERGRNRGNVYRAFER